MTIRDFSYDVTRVLPSGGGRAVQVARMHCKQCAAHEDINIPDRHNPERLDKSFEARGWSFTRGNKASCLCPKCVAEKAALRRGERIVKPIPFRPLTPEKPTMSNPPPPSLTVVPATPGATPPRPEDRKLITEERSAIRRLFDAHFDDEKGAYLDGYSDARIAREVDVPTAMVTQMREIAYGQLKVPPEVLELRGEVQRLQKALEDTSRVLSGTQEALNALHRRLNDYERKATGGVA